MNSNATWKVEHSLYYISKISPQAEVWRPSLLQNTDIRNPWFPKSFGEQIC